jgi:hypothetical protein
MVASKGCASIKALSFSFLDLRTFVRLKRAFNFHFYKHFTYRGRFEYLIDY